MWRLPGRQVWAWTNSSGSLFLANTPSRAQLLFTTEADLIDSFPLPPPFLAQQCTHTTWTRPLYTDPGCEGFQTYTLNNWVPHCLSSFQILTSLKDNRPNQGDFSRSQKISLIREFQKQWRSWKIAQKAGLSSPHLPETSLPLGTLATQNTC